MASGLIVESLRGRPLFRFGETGASFSTVTGFAGGEEICSTGRLGGRPGLRFTGAGLSVFAVAGDRVLSFVGLESCFLGGFGERLCRLSCPLPLPTPCCSPN